MELSPVQSAWSKIKRKIMNYNVPSSYGWTDIKNQLFPSVYLESCPLPATLFVKHM